MKRGGFFLAAAILAASLNASAAPPRTMRLDYYHTGNAAEERFSVDRVVLEPLAWAGGRPVDDTNLGKYFFEVIDRRTNRVLVGPQELLGRRGLEADRVSWVSGAPPAEGAFEGQAQVRSSGDPVPSVVRAREDGSVTIEFRAAQRGIAPGQSVVLYRGDELLGGGRILTAVR